VNIGETVIFAGSGTDSDGTIAAYEWTPPFGVTLTNSEIQTVTVGGSGLTSFTLTYSGQTTSSLDDLATAAEVQAALEALSNIAVGDVAVVGDAGGPWTVTFKGALVNTNVAQMTSTPTGGTGTVTVATLRAGAATSATTILNPTWYTDTVLGGDYTFALRVQDDDGAWSEPDTVKVTVVAPPVEPVPGVTEIPQFVSCQMTYTPPFNVATRIVRFIRTGGSGATPGTGLPYTFPATFDATAASGDAVLVRRAYSGPGDAVTFAPGGTEPALTVERSIDSGVTSEVIRFADGVPADGSTLEVLDGEAVPHVIHHYRGRSTVVSDGLLRTSEWSPWAIITPTPASVGIKDPTDPTGNVMLTVLDFGSEASARLATEHQVFGQSTAVIVATGWTSARGQLTVFVDTQAQRLALRQLVQAGTPLLLQRPSEDGTEEGEQWYIEPLGDLSEDRLTTARHPARTMTFGWREVERP
jgi:hypothetical protein